ncbi:MAG: glucosylglycerol hydrolase [Aggregatilineales bacterium]
MIENNYRLLEDQTVELVQWAQSKRKEATTDFEAAQKIMPRLGAHYINGNTEFGFWAPQLVNKNIAQEHIYLELLTPTKPIDFSASQQEIRFDRTRFSLVQDGVYLWGVVSGITAGTRDIIGDFYWVRYKDKTEKWHTITDLLAYSVPFGVFAPSEVYDMVKLQAERADKTHFQQLDLAPDSDGIMRVQEPTNILQIHPGTASPEGTLLGLTRIYERIALKIQSGEELSPFEQNYVGYDAVQLMPIEPPIEHEAGLPFWEEKESDAESVNVNLRKHDIINWGYDVMIAASPAPNPSVLTTKRPDELMDFITTLHNFPEKPIKVMFDIVYGHTDNQAIPLLPDEFLAGANMYGQNLNYLHPVTRAIMLEMQRRKHSYGVDGIRVDGAQDFKWWDEQSNSMIHDDDYLRLMNDIVLEVAGTRYRPWMIFEDGRPWPREDWEIASSYREVTKQMPNVWQWGPLTFAHNTPFLFTFWVNKWWRIREMAEIGRNWITGCANHDTLRRGTQVPTDARINTYLGDTLPEIIRNGYDNPAAKLFDYAMMPGIPMDFINASMRAPWSFIRNTDDKFGVKVVSEEARFSEWLMTEARYTQNDLFPRLKQFGFKTLPQLRDFLFVLDHAVQATRYDLEAVARIMNSRWTPDVAGPELTVKKLKEFALDWMEDVHEFCNVSHFIEEVHPERAQFNLNLRNFRRARSWLLENLRDGEVLDYCHPTDGKSLFFGLRNSPDGKEQILFIANMEGSPHNLNPFQVPIPNLQNDGWTISLTTPNLEITAIDQPITLKDSQGVVFTRLR